MIDYFIGQDSKYDGVDRLILPRKPRAGMYGLPTPSMGIAGAASKFQKTKYQILKTLMLKEQRGEVGQGTWQELKALLPVDGDGVRLSCWRMNVGYIDVCLGRYRHPYLWRTPQKRYRLLQKGRRFVQRMEQQQSDLTKLWSQELINYGQQLEQIKQKVAVGRRNWIINCINKGILPKGVGRKELREIREALS